MVIPRSRSRSFEIHGALGDALVLPERTGLLQQPVHQGGLAMVDMGDNRDIAQLHAKLGCCGMRLASHESGARPGDGSQVRATTDYAMDRALAI